MIKRKLAPPAREPVTVHAFRADGRPFIYTDRLPALKPGDEFYDGSEYHRVVVIEGGNVYAGRGYYEKGQAA